MPLRTDDILQARAAYEALEARAQSAEQRAARLQTLIAQLRNPPPPEVDLLALLHQRILDLEAENSSLRKRLDQQARLKTQDFVAATAVGAALREGCIPGRSITSVKADVETYLAPAERTFYAVLQDKQRLLAQPFLTALAPARQVLVKIADMFANAGAWRFDYLAQAAAALAASERDLASLLAQKLGPDVPTAYAAAVEALAALTDSLTGKANPATGALLTLASALDTTTRSLRTLVPSG